uniref:Glucose-methanol-choline oxidoreductase N-terminal domain-containing protein n=1 Tax=Romanomermis culicivorax TaxID=13658 RepID=A0A915IW40_ROMCU
MLFTARNFLKSSLFFALFSFFIYKILFPGRSTRMPAQLSDIYDFVIVGAGTAGCVLAARLSAAPNNFTVLLLEAGGEETSLIYSHVPKMAALIAGSILDWKFESQKAEHCCQDLKNGGKHKYPQSF